jgi:hypothetical protein
LIFRQSCADASKPQQAVSLLVRKEEGIGVGFVNFFSGFKNLS